MNEVLTLALAKGRLAEKTFDLLEKMGIDCSAPRNPGRQLVLWDEKQNIRFILVKPSDVPTYVDHGVADLGVVGKDTLMEAGRGALEPAQMKDILNACDRSKAGPTAPPEGLTLVRYQILGGKSDKIMKK